MSTTISTQCPVCKKRYNVTIGQLRVADGQVRCGNCMTVFDAAPKKRKETLAPPKTSEPSKTSQKTSEENQAPKNSDQLERAQSNGNKLNSSNNKTQTPKEPVAKARIGTTNQTNQSRQADDRKPTDKANSFSSLKPTTPLEPSIITQVRALKIEPPQLDAYAEKPPIQVWAIIGTLFALLLMAGQYLWFERAALSKDPLFIPVYELACQYIDCTLSSPAGLSALDTTHLIVREVTDQPQVLELLTGVHNTSLFPIQLPHLRLQFIDGNGRVIAARDITAKTYRPQTELIQPNEKLSIRLLIKRPTTGHLGYEIDWIARSSL